MTNSKPQPSIRIIKKATCPSISPNSNATLSYYVGYNDDNDDILFRVTGNTGGGYMNTTWWSLTEVLDVLARVPDDSHFKSTLFSPIFRGRSANSMGFAVAVMRQEKLLAPVSGKPFPSMKNLSEKPTGKHSKS